MTVCCVAGGSAELRIEALEVAKNWTANGLLSGKLVAAKARCCVVVVFVVLMERDDRCCSR